MPRVSRIDQQLGRSTAAPPEWTPAWVLARVVEVYAIEKRMPRTARGNGSAWLFPVKHDFADIVHWDDARERVWEAWSRSSGVMPWEVSRAEEAADWVHDFLAGHSGERRCLQEWAKCQAHGWSVRHMLKRRHWARSTFRRKVEAAALRIATQLNVRGVPVR